MTNHEPKTASPAIAAWHNDCSIFGKLRGFVQAFFLELLKFRSVRRFWHIVERTIPFLAAVFSQDGIASPDGRQLIWGKFRRVVLSSFPPLAKALQKHHGISGGCVSCGASCKLLFQCPHWDDSSHLCRVYEDRPNICRLFPITPADIRDRDIVAGRKHACGFSFLKDAAPAPIRIPVRPKD